MNTVMPIRDQKHIEDLKASLKNSPRNYLFLIFGLNSGLRVSDLLALKVKDVNGDGYIRIKEKKTSKAKKFIINTALMSVLIPYIKDMQGDDFLFQSRIGVNKPITRAMAHKIIKKAAAQVGLTEISCHSLRKTLAYQIYIKNNHDIALVMTLLNHDSQKTSLNYLGINQSVMDSAIEKVNI